MTDRFGRQIDYMRISITDRCNLHCSYCRPEILEHLVHSDLLCYEEIFRVCRIAVKLGIDRFKITGGEPFVRSGAVDFIKGLAGLGDVKSVTVTTNGTLINGDVIKELKKAGLDGINISLDTMDRVRFSRITGENLLDKVISNIDLCCEAGLKVKINTVLLPDIREEDVLALSGLAKEGNISVRFIEKMPMGNMTENGPSGRFIKDILTGHGTELGYIETGRLGNGPAVYYRPEGYKGYIGFIEAIHGKFCSSCNRIRMTSTGFVKPCLYYSDGIDIRGMIRSGADDELIAKSLSNAVYMKPECHEFEVRPSSGKMNTIGG